MRRFAWLSAALALGLTVSACASSTSDAGAGAGGGGGGGGSGGGNVGAAAKVLSKFVDMPLAERDPQLLELAKKDGNTVSWYGGWQHADLLAKAFTAKYGIKVDLYSSDNETSLQKAVQQEQAGKHLVDVIEMSYLQQEQIRQTGYMYEGFKADVSSDDYVTQKFTPGFTVTRMLGYLVAWNTDKIHAADAPSSFEDLTKPVWKGQLALELGDWDWYATLVKYFTDKGKSDSEIQDLFTKIAANSRPIKGHTDMANLLAAGDYAGCVDCYQQSLQDVIDDKAPVTYTTKAGGVVEPVVTSPSGESVFKSAPHPAAAMLLVDWLLSPEAQQIYGDGGQIPALKSLSGDFFTKYDTVLPPAGEMVGASGKQHEAQYNAIVQGAGQ